MKNGDPIATHYRLKRPCANCPFLRTGAIELAPGRLEGVVNGLIEDDRSTFQCHKTVHSPKGGEFDDDGKYHASGNEAMCYGAASYLMKIGRPTIGMRLGIITGYVPRSFWDDHAGLIIDPLSQTDCERS